MEPEACLEEVVKLHDNFKVKVRRLCCDDDSSVRKSCRWSNIIWLAHQPPGAKLPLVKKKVGKNKGELQERPDKGQLPARVPEPEFVADPNHRRKQLTKDLITLDTSNVDKRCTMTRMDSTRIGKNFGYMARTLKSTPPEEYVNKAKAVLEHHFDNHEFCGEWCSRKLQTDTQRQEGKRYYRSKERDAKLYVLLKSIVENYTTFDRLKDIAHGMDTNCCEAFNNLMTWYAPKNKIYCGSRSLWNRVCLCIGIISIGILPYFRRLFRKLGIVMTPNVLHFLEVQHRTRTKRLTNLKTNESKRKRNKRKHEMLTEYTTIAKKERARREGYKTGMNLEDEEGDGKPKAKRRRTIYACPHPFCKKKGHKTTRSTHCLANPDRLQREGLEAACAAAVAAAVEADTVELPVPHQGDIAGANEHPDNDAANDLDAYESQPFEQFEDDMFYQTGTWSEDDEGNIVLESEDNQRADI